jgi:hypothetical protein
MLSSLLSVRPGAVRVYWLAVPGNALSKRTRVSERKKAGILRALSTCQSNEVTENYPGKYEALRSVLLGFGLFRKAIVRRCTTRSCNQSCRSVKEMEIQPGHSENKKGFVLRKC